MRNIALVLILSGLVAQAADNPRGMKVVYGEARTALVIGNGAYRVSPLANPPNDADDIAKALRDRRFQVTLLKNASLASMESAVRDFGRSLRSGGVGLFYYAGHGVQIAGRNYLVPVGTDIQAEHEVKLKSLDVEMVLGYMAEANNRLNLVILDACRDNPFASGFRTQSRGLAQMDAPVGTLIAYATAPGRTAIDGTGRNGLYTSCVLEEMAIPGQEIGPMFKRVRARVRQKTDGKQVPWEATSLEGDFHFTPVDVGLPSGSSRPEEGALTAEEGSARKTGCTMAVDLGDGVKMELVWIEPGTFTMGSPPSEDGRGDDETQHRVTLTKGFWMGKYEVTQEQWQQVMGSNPTYFENAGKTAPVEQVSWDDCQDFMRKLKGRKVDGSFRLPTEAEWEYACRAGTTTALNSGKDLTSTNGSCRNLDAVAWYDEISGNTTHPVGKKAPNAWGLYDMHGNVWEWCQDWYGAYPRGSATDPEGASSGPRRVRRGGSWVDAPRYCRSAYRNFYFPSIQFYGSVGFRVVLSRVHAPIDWAKYLP